MSFSFVYGYYKYHIRLTNIFISFVFFLINNVNVPSCQTRLIDEYKSKSILEIVIEIFENRKTVNITYSRYENEFQIILILLGAMHIHCVIQCANKRIFWVRFMFTHALSEIIKLFSVKYVDHYETGTKDH